MRKYLYLFLLAFGLNWLWENLHAVLYVNYQGHEITQWVLTRAAFWDAVFILVIVFVSLLFGRKWQRVVFIIATGLLLAVAIEWWALETDRWAYGALMPIVPLFGTGLTPTLQLALTGYLSYIFIHERSS